MRAGNTSAANGDNADVYTVQANQLFNIFVVYRGRHVSTQSEFRTHEVVGLAKVRGVHRNDLVRFLVTAIFPEMPPVARDEDENDKNNDEDYQPRKGLVCEETVASNIAIRPPPGMMARGITAAKPSPKSKLPYLSAEEVKKKSAEEGNDERGEEQHLHGRD